MESKVELFYDNGQLKERYYIDDEGKLNGVYKRWFPNGYLAEKSIYVDDVNLDKFAYKNEEVDSISATIKKKYTNGQPRKQYSTNDNGYAHGDYFVWYEHGLLKEKRFYENGILIELYEYDKSNTNSTSSLWDEEGDKVLEHSEYVNGQKVKQYILSTDDSNEMTLKQWTATGKLQEATIYKDDDIIEQRIYDTNTGNMIKLIKNELDKNVKVHKEWDKNANLVMSALYKNDQLVEQRIFKTKNTELKRYNINNNSDGEWYGVIWKYL